MSKFDEATNVGIVYYKNGTLKDLLKVMEDVTIYSDFKYKSYTHLNKKESERYKKENASVNVDNPIFVYFKDDSGKVRFGCYSGVNMRKGQKIYIDESGDEYCLDELGNKIVPTWSKKESQDGEFTTYDSSKGHCGLCGNIACNGGCFK